MLIGLILATSQFVAGHHIHGWLWAGLLITTGLLMFARWKLGTVLLAAGIAYGLYWRVIVEGLSDESFFQLALTALIILGLVSFLFGQIKYFKAQTRPEDAAAE